MTKIWSLLLVMDMVLGDLAYPRENVLNSIGSVGNVQTIPLVADIVIPDGRDLFLPIHVPPVYVGVNSNAPCKIQQVTSPHANGLFGIGELIDIDVKYTSPVDVGGTPTLRMRTGCHAASCRVKEIQKIVCSATSGKFAVSYQGQTISNIPFDSTPLKLTNYLKRLTSLSAIKVTYDAGIKACTFYGTSITIQFDRVNFLGVDGDLPSLTTDPLNLKGDTIALNHHTRTVVLTPVAIEVQKGVSPTDRYALFVGMRNPSTLTFHYVVAYGDISLDLDYVDTDALSLNGGSIYNAGTLLPASLTLPVPGLVPTWATGMTSSLSINRDIALNSNIPVITNVAPTSSDGIYGQGEVIEIKITFSLPVAVIGTPTLLLATGINSAVAPVVRVESGGLVLVTRYTVSAGDYSLDLTYVDTNSFVLNQGGSILRLSTTPTLPVNMSLPPNGLPGSLFNNANIVIDTSPPYILSITSASPNGMYTTGDVLTFNLIFSRGVVVTGVPQFQVSTGTVNLSPNFYVVRVPTQGDAKKFMFPEQIDWSWLEPGFTFVVGGSEFTVATVLGYQITTVESYVGSPVNLGNDPNSPQLSIFSRGYQYATYVSGSSTTTLQFSYRVKHGDTSSNLATASNILLPTGSTILRRSTTPITPVLLVLPSPGTTGSLNTVCQIVINTNEATVVSITSTTRSGVYSSNFVLGISVQFSQPVVVFGPSIPGLLTNLGENRFALYASGSGTNTLLFKIPIQPTDLVTTLAPMSLDAIRMPNVFTSIRRMSMNPLDGVKLTLPSLVITGSAISVDPSATYILGINIIAPTTTVYRPGDTVIIAIEFTDSVLITGTPLMDLNILRSASYLTGSGTSTVHFQYLVAYGDTIQMLDITGSTALRLNGGTITSVATGNTVCVALDNMQLRYNKLPSSVSSAPFRVTRVSSWTVDGNYTLGDSLLLVAQFSDDVFISGSPQLLLRTGNPAGDQTASYHSADANLVYFMYPIQAGDSTSLVVEASSSALQCVNDPGLNSNSLLDASAASGCDWNGRLIVCWSEQNQIMVKIFNNNPDMPLWSSLSASLNVDTTRIATGCSCISLSTTQLFCSWQETTTPGNTVIHASVMTGTVSNPTWTLLSSTGLNGDNAKNAIQPTAFVSNAGRASVIWQEINAGGLSTLQIKSWDGNIALPQWTVINAPTLVATSNHQEPTSKLFNNQLVIAWTESSTGPVSMIHVSMYNGALWVAMENSVGLNLPTKIASKPAIGICNSKLYVGWKETTSGADYIRVQEYNAVLNTWSYVDGGNGVQTGTQAGHVTLTCFQNQLFIAWFEDQNGITMNRVAFVDASTRWIRTAPANDNIQQSAINPVLVVSSSLLYLVWTEVHINSKSQIRVGQYVSNTQKWLSMTYSCLKRLGSGFNVPFALTLPMLYSQNSLGDTSKLRLDTAIPTVASISVTTAPGLYRSADYVQTLSIVGVGSTITAGSFSIGYNNIYSSCIAWDATEIILQNALKSISGLALDVVVSKVSQAFQHGAFYRITFVSPAIGVHPLQVGSGCLDLICTSGTVCGRLQANPDRSEMFALTLQPGYVDFRVDFTSPVHIVGATPVLSLSNGASAVYLPGSLHQIIDVGVTGPSKLLAGSFALGYGNTNSRCIDVQSVDGVGSMLYELLLLPEIGTIGIVDIRSQTIQNGLRYHIRFQSGAPLALQHAPSVICTPLVGHIQTIDLVSTAQVTAGGFYLGYGSLVSTTCTPHDASASTIQSAIAVLSNNEVQVTVNKHPLPQGGYRFAVTFVDVKAASKGLTVTTTGCTALVCPGGTCLFSVNNDFKVSQASTSVLHFRYSIQPNVMVPALSYNSLSGGIQRASATPSIPALLTLPTQLTSPGIQVDTSSPPVIKSVISISGNGVYSEGNLILLSITLDKPVVVVGRPSIELNSFGDALYLSGSGTTTLTFQYFVGSGESSIDLDCFSAYSLLFPTRSGIYFEDLVTKAWTPIDPLLPVGVSPKSLATQSNIVIDTIVPNILTISSSKPAGMYGAGELIDFIIQFSHSVIVSGTPSITLNTGGAAMFTLAGHRQLLDIGVTAKTSITAGEYALWYGDMLTECITFNNVAMLQSKLLDLPAIAAIGLVSATSIAFGNGQRIVITFASTDIHQAPLELVPVTPPQCLPLAKGKDNQLLVSRGLDAYLTFRYSVQQGEVGNPMAITSTAIDPQGGYIRRASEHPSIGVLLTLIPASLNAIEISGIVPTIVQVTVLTAGGSYGVAYPPTPNPSYIKPGQILFVVTFSHEVVLVDTITIQMNTGRPAQFHEKVNPKQFSFVYTVQPGDVAASLDFENPSALQGRIVTRSTTNNQVVNTLLPLMALSGANIIVVDCNLPAAVITVSSTHPDGTVGAGEVIPIQVGFGRPVRILSGLNHDLLRSVVQKPSITHSNGMMYIGWSEEISSTSSIVYVAQYDGVTFQEISPASGLNRDLSGGKAMQTSLIVHNGQLIAAWDESGVVYLTQFSGNLATRIWLDLPFMGSNQNQLLKAYDPQLFSYMNTLFLVWQEHYVDSIEETKIRVASQDSNKLPPWTFYDTVQKKYGLNQNRATDPHAISFGGHFYLAWAEFNGTCFTIRINVLSLSTMNFVSIPQVGFISREFLTGFGPKLFAQSNQLMVQWYAYPAASVQPTMHTGIITQQYWRELIEVSPVDGGIHDVVTCNDESYLAWVLQMSASRQLFAAKIDVNGALASNRSIPLNHNPIHDVTTIRMQCTASGVAMIWTEYDGISHKLRLRLTQDRAVTWIEQTISLATLQLSTGLVATNIDHSGSCLSTLNFKLTVASQTPAITHLNAVGIVLNRANVLDCTSNQQANIILFTAPTDARSLAYNSHIEIDTTQVVVLDVSTTTPTGSVGAGEQIPIIVQFSQPVTMSTLPADGNASAWITFQSQVASLDGSNIHRALYRSGNGSNSLVFIYTTLSSDKFILFDYMHTNSLELKSGAWIRRASTFPVDDALLTLPPPGQGHSLSRSFIAVDTTAPVILDISVSNPTGTYYPGDVIHLVVLFSLPVVVLDRSSELILNTRVIPFRSGAKYISGSGSTQLSFDYIVRPLDQTSKLGLFDDRVSQYGSYVEALEAGVNTILRLASIPTTPAILACPAPNTPHSIPQTIILDSTVPTVVGVTTSTPDGTYDVDSVVMLQVLFSSPVVVTGTPLLILNVYQDGTRGASYQSGSGTTILTFRYQVRLGDNAWPLDYLNVHALQLRTPMRLDPLQDPPFATINRLSSNPVLPANVELPPLGPLEQVNLPPNLVRGNHMIYIRTDGVRISAIGSSVARGVYAAGHLIEIKVHFTSTVVVVGVPKLILNVPTQATYVSGTGTSHLLFNYIVGTSDLTSLLNVNDFNLPAGASLRDVYGANVPTSVPSSGAPSSLGAATAISISTTPPTVQLVLSVPKIRSYATGDTIQIQVLFTAAVVATGTPLLLLNNGRSATYLSGSSSSTLVFVYTVLAGDTGILEYASINALSGIIKAKSTTPTTDAILTLPAIGGSNSLYTTSEITFNTMSPVVVDVSFPTIREQVYTVGAIFAIQIRFSFPVAVVGNPTLELATKGYKNNLATYIGGSGSALLHFMYTVQAGDATSMLDYTSVNALQGTILQYSSVPTLSATLTLPVPGSPQSLSGKARVNVCQICPRVISLAGPPSGVYTGGHIINFILTFSQEVMFDPLAIQQASPTMKIRLAIPLERYATYVSGSGTSTWTFSYQVQPGDDVNPLEIANSDAMFGNKLVSVSSMKLPVSLTLPAPAYPSSFSSNFSIRIDTSPPTIIEVKTTTSDGVYGPGESIAIDIVFSAPVIASGTPTLLLGLLPQPREAVYNAAGSTPLSVRFVYVVQPGDYVFRLDYMRICSDSAYFDQIEGYDNAATGLACLPVETISAIQLNGGSIKAVANVPTVDASLVLPHVNPWPTMRYLDNNFSINYTKNDRSPTASRSSTESSICIFLQEDREFLLLANGIPMHSYPKEVLSTTYLFELARYPTFSLSRFRPTDIVGIMLNGVPFNNSNTLVQGDSCGGAIDPLTKRYSYVGVPSCYITSPSSLLGYVLDGFPIYSPTNPPISLDECNGVMGLDGVYRYYINPITIEATGTFIPCFKGTITTNGNQVVVTRAPDVGGIEGFRPSPINLKDILVIPRDLSGLWLNAASVSISTTASTLIISSTGIPDGPFGPFPNAFNPNRVLPQNYQFRIPRTPIRSPTPITLPFDAVGVMLNGIPFYNTIDQDGNSLLDVRILRHLILDRCNGYVDAGGDYRYYAPPNCLLEQLGEVAGKPSPLIGYAFDGYPVFGRYDANGRVPTLDACNGRVNELGDYQYHVTDTPPYTIGCYRGIVAISNVPYYRSLSITSAITIDPSSPYITDITTMKAPGVFVVGEVIDVVILWSAPVVITGVPVLTLAVMNNITRVHATALYSPDSSSERRSVFLYTVGSQEFFSDVVVASPTALQLPLGASIKRKATIPTLDAILTCPVASLGSRIQGIANVQVNVRGLYHPDAQDLAAYVMHNDIRARLFDPIPMAGYHFGRPRDMAARVGIEDQVSAIGNDYTFVDNLLSINLAHEGIATQSSTFGTTGTAANAIDGIRHAYYSSMSVSRTSGITQRDPSPWWQLRLDHPSTIGTIKLFNVAQQRSQFEVQIVTVSGPIPVEGTFSLLCGTCTTPPISVQAVAMRRDETIFGESFQAKLEHCTGEISVSRSTRDRMGGYSWMVTFIQDVGSIALMTVASYTQTTLEATVTTIFDSTDNVWYSYQTPMKGLFSDTLYPCYIMIFDALSMMAFESLQDALAASIWNRYIPSGEMETTILIPKGIVGQYIRIQHNSPTQLSLAEVEVYAEYVYTLSGYIEGSPIAKKSFDGNQLWAPEVSFQYAFGGQIARGEWQLIIQDRRRSLGQLKDKHPLQGEGGLSEWELVITNTAGTTTTYYMAMSARVTTIPKYGDLLVDIRESETDHLDAQGNGYLDTTEAIHYLTTYWPNFRFLDDFTQFRIIQDTMDTYATYGRLKIIGQQGQRRWIAQTCEGCVMPPTHLELYNSASVASKQHILDKRRTVQYLPSSSFVGLDMFNFQVSLNNVDVPGMVRIQVLNCREATCSRDLYLAQSMKQPSP